MEKLLLHSCCGPCSSGVLDQLTTNYIVTVFFYNPNIYPEEEYVKRAEAQHKYLNQIGVSSVFCDYTPEDYESVVKGLEGEPEGGNRCLECFRIRLEKTAQYAKEKGYDVFTTTLSVSPHKDYIAINKIGKELEAKYGVKYLEANFKKNDGYLKSIQNSKLYGIYRQNYCGCKYSIPKQN